MNMEATKTKQCNALRSASPSRWNVLEVKRRLPEAPQAGGGGGESRVRPVGAPVLPYGNIRYTSFATIDRSTGSRRVTPGAASESDRAPRAL